MARMEMAEAALGGAPFSSDAFFELGLRHSIGNDGPVDLVAAHKWFNLAAMRGNAEATRLRREIADLMSETDIAVAQREARAWLKSH